VQNQKCMTSTTAGMLVTVLAQYQRLRWTERPEIIIWDINSNGDVKQFNRSGARRVLTFKQTGVPKMVLWLKFILILTVRKATALPLLRQRTGNSFFIICFKTVATVHLYHLPETQFSNTVFGSYGGGNCAHHLPDNLLSDISPTKFVSMSFIRLAK
jgi:hypothetical protein